MQQVGEQLLLSASDLANFLACRHLSGLDQQAALGRIKRPVQFGPRLDALRERGNQHEFDYVQHLREQNLQVVELNQEFRRPDSEETLRCMQRGVDVIVQAGFASGRWQGLADVLRRVRRPSNLGNWSYEVIDTKLAQETRAGTVLQLCLYSDLLEQLQGTPPRSMHVVKPGDPFTTESFRVADYQAYYRLVCRQLIAAVDNGPPADTFPYPVEHCQVCRWWRDCDQRRRDDDHLSLVAGIRTLQIHELESRGVATLADFAGREQALDTPPTRGSIESFQNAHGQARVQLEGRRRGQPVWEFLPIEPERGFCRLPAPSDGDIFLDFEGDPHVPGGGLEYLTGYAWYDDHGAVQYHPAWATSLEQERAAYETFIDFVRARLAQYPDLHVYHYASYEPTALKRLMGRFASRVLEMDELLRGGRLIDLHLVARQGLQASVERYSLKDLERLAGYTRELDLREASAALRRLEHALEFGRLDAITDDDRQRVAAYNRDDCLATIALRDWLETQRTACAATHGDIPRPAHQPAEASETVTARAEEVRQVYEQLVADLPLDRAERTRPQQGRWLLAHLLEYFRREERCAWWEFFRLCELDDQALLDERKGISGLAFERRDGGRDLNPIHVYRFPPQEVSLDEGDQLHASAELKFGTITEIDQVNGRVWIRKSKAAADRHPTRAVVNEFIGAGDMPDALLEIARGIVADGFEQTPDAAARDLLLQRPPRFAGAERGAQLRRPEEPVLEAAARIALQLDGSVLALQGPPGAGKTYVGARTIVRLVQAGKRVGITAVSHSVIRNLIDEVQKALAETGDECALRHKCGDRRKVPQDDISGKMSPEEIEAVLAAGGVVGATVWHWARPGSAGILDYLFVDEAGQMSLAMVLAGSRAARNLVMLGDPQQLEQPQRGAHPDGAEVAALQHFLDGHETIRPEQGLFLDQTWRLSPDVCRFTSEIFYESKLTAGPDTQLQTIIGDSPLAGSGLYHVPAVHIGNQNPAPEEVEIVARLVDHLTGTGLEWVHREGRRTPLGTEDVLIVAPYNAQVRALSARLPHARVGTVDKFQGQEAAVVIYSMTSSSAEDAPRGLGFLYDLHRLNVATSRARCAVILVATERLFAPECRSPEQIRLANALCRYREMATSVAPF